MKVIGITGGIGSGKSRVLSYLEEAHQAVICETDKAAHRLQEKGKECYTKIVEHFGKEILDQEGKIDRKALGNIVFSNEEEMKELNHIVHPLVKKYVKDKIKEAKEQNKKYFVIESALLLDDHYEEICDEIWYIHVKEEIRRQRLKESRGLSDEKITDIIKTQADEKTLTEYSDFIIENSASFEETVGQIEKVINRR